jgi:uncharacterized protein
MSESLTVEHRPEESRFVCVVDGITNVADYQMRGDRIVMTHTWVDPSLQGRGIAAALVATALLHARDQGLKVVAACSYVDAYLRRRPELADLRA